MPRRRIIRTLFLLPILLGHAGWLWSSTHGTGVGYRYGDRGVFLGTEAGALRFVWSVAPASERGWESFNLPLDPPEFWPSKTRWDDVWFLGFSYCHLDSTPPGLAFHDFIGVPYWFPLVVFSGIFAWVCRQTGGGRRKPDPKTAFPVEVAAVGGASAAGKPDEKKP